MKIEPTYIDYPYLAFGILKSTKPTYYGYRMFGEYKGYKIEAYIDKRKNTRMIYLADSCKKWIKSKLIYWENGIKKVIRSKPNGTT